MPICLLVAAVWLLAGGSAPAVGGGPACTSSGVCATSSDRPDAVAASTAATVREVALDTSLVNGAPNKLSQVEFVQTVPAGFVFVQDDLGACTAAAGSVTCVHGQVAGGDTVANTLVYRTPVLPSGTQQTSTFAGTWCWDGCRAHSPGAARVDSLDVPETTTVRAVEGFDATYLRAGVPAALGTGAAASDTNPLAGTWTIPGQPAALAATAAEKPNPAGFQACPSDGKRCRSGDWFGALSPGTEGFSPFTTVVYTQNKSVIPPGTNASNYEVVYTPCLPGEDPAHPAGCPAVRLPPCTSPSEARCTESVTKLPGGSYRIQVRIGSHNGYMK